MTQSSPKNPYVTKDNGTRTEFDSGMQREIKAGLPRFELLVPEGVPYSEQMLTRLASLVAKGAEKYASRDWEQACTQEELESFRASAHRHFMQFMCGESDEDHAAAVMFNVMAVETIRYKIAAAEKQADTADNE